MGVLTCFSADYAYAYACAYALVKTSLNSRYYIIAVFLEVGGRVAGVLSCTCV